MIKAPTVLINPEKTVVDPKEFDAFQKVLKDFEGKLDAQEVLDLAVKVLKALLEKVDPLSPAKKNADALATTLGLLTGSPEPSQCAAPAGTPGQSTNPGPTTTGKGEGNVL
jgi:hypothetical protein